MIYSGIQYELLYVFPSKLWAWDDMRRTVFGLEVRALDCKRGLAMSHRLDRKTPWKKTFEGGDCASQYELLRAQLIFLMETQWIRPVPVVSHRAVMDDHWVNVLKARVGDYEVTYYLDPETYLPHKVDIIKRASQPWEAVDAKVLLADYALVDGISLPRKIRFDDFGWFPPARFKINVDYDERIFEEPPHVEDGPEGWQRPPQASK